MKRPLFLFILTLSALSVFAQEGTQNIGFNLGFSDAIIRGRKSASSTKLDGSTSLYGLKAGFVYEATYVAGFGMQIGLNYTFGANLGKWQSQTQVSNYPMIRQNYTYHQIEIPIDWQYKFEIARQTYLILYTGPTIEIGLSLSQKEYTKQLKSGKEVITKKDPVKIYSMDGDGDGIRDYYRTNITWGIGAGFQYKQYFIRGGYDFGIMSPYRDKYAYKDATKTEEWRRKGRFDQWSIKLGIYIWQFGN